MNQGTETMAGAGRVSRVEPLRDSMTRELAVARREAAELRLEVARLREQLAQWRPVSCGTRAAENVPAAHPSIHLS